MGYELKLTTRVLVWKNGVLQYDGPNFIVKAGRIRLAQLLTQESNVLPTYMAIGDDGTPTTDVTSDLGNEVASRINCVVTRTDNNLKWPATFGTGIVSAVTVREIGIFDASSGGNLLSRVRPADFLVGPGDSIAVEWNIRLGDI